MKYKVRIRPIATDIAIILGSYDSEEAAWNWVEANNLPFVDYDVVPESETPPEK